MPFIHSIRQNDQTNDIKLIFKEYFYNGAKSTFIKSKKHTFVGLEMCFI